ncbi:NADH-ubiquinone oxidoreductase subunit [Exophiala aquamarina CBS 119918]|uniref:NADH dehydrogenase [ubiquinone] 1 alpha subcomplex subunit n=1 Tax=Exophiala aquamarina CBS 119918 TaxID=1182545 RepID=A0A072PL47_9EURO|nr:NADH-ubiquinone oxidoreductase subunit [Exophiala aquamarina CBS 119918]KEF60611.1 NADH-ubiquinone oxidoreductase subunit [Exophiala aquamarina CBS 119918]
MSTLTRTFRNLWKIGIKDYGHQMQYIGDTKFGVLIGTDRWGNKYYENLEEELPLRTRWVDYKDYELDASQIDPGWHAWMSYNVDKPPTEDKIMALGIRPWESKVPVVNNTASRAAYRPYSTTKPKYEAWQPVAKARTGA